MRIRTRFQGSTALSSPVRLLLSEVDSNAIVGFINIVLGSTPSVSVTAASFTTSYQDISFTFSPALTIKRDKQYIVLPMEINAFQTTAEEIFWEGYMNKGLALQDASGIFSDNGGGAVTPNIIEGLNLFIQVLIPAYSYDGVTTNYRDIKIDLGEVPTVGPGTFDFDYRTPGDSVVVFTAWWSDTGSFSGEETSLGTVSDGDEISVLKRYFKIKCELSSSGLLYTASIHKLNIIYPANVHRFSSAIIDIPNTIPAIKSIPSIPTKLDLKGYLAQTQKFTLQLVDMDGYASLMALEENLKNSTVDIKIGNADQVIDSKDDLAPYASGKIVDYSFTQGLLSVSIQDRSKDFSLKLPRPLANSADPPPAIQDTINKKLVDVLDNLLFNEIRIPRRYKDTASFNDIRDNKLGAQWVSGRIVKEPTEARELVAQLLEVIGCFLVSGEDGKLRLIQYPRSGNALITWDNDDLFVGTTQTESFDKSIINLCIVRFDFTDKEFRGYQAVVDEASPQDWAPGAGIYIADRKIDSKWIGSEGAFNGRYLAEAVAQRIVKHAKDGVITIKAKTSLKHLAIQVGDFIDLKTPVFLRKGTRGSLNSAQKFMVSSKNPNINTGIIDWELVEARDVNRPPIPSFTLDVSSGVPNFTVNVDASATTDPDGDAISTYEWDWDYDGSNFQIDDTGSIQSHQYVAANIGRKVLALRVTDSNGATAILTKVVRVLGNPTAIISMVTQTNSGQPLQAIFDGSGSTSPAGIIDKYEWDLTYDGVTFNVDVTGVQAQISIPHKTTTVALRVTDGDSLTNITSQIITGKTLAPPSVTAFFVEQLGDNLVFRWDPNPDLDLLGYEIRRKSGSTGTWDTATLEATEIALTAIELPAPRPGTFTYFVKAIDTTGNYSATATSIIMEVLDPNNRNVLVEKDEKALGWPGTVVDLTYDVGGDQWVITATGETWYESSSPTFTLNVLNGSAGGNLL